MDISLKPIVASFTNQTDKWEVLCLARVIKNGAITITEDIPGKRALSRQDQSADRAKHLSGDRARHLSGDRARHLSVERAKSRESSEYTARTNYSSETETNLNYSVFEESTCESYRTDL